MRKGLWEDNRPPGYLQLNEKSIKPMIPSMKDVKQAYSIDNKQLPSFTIEELSHLNDWIQHRLFYTYLTKVISAINMDISLSEDTKAAFLFNAKRTTSSLDESDEWRYLGAQLVDQMNELSLEEQIEMLKYPNHEKSWGIKNQIIKSRMIETLIIKQDDFAKMYKQVIEQATIIIDLLEAYELSLHEVKIEEINIQFDEVLKAMQISYLKLEAGDRLELEKCITVDVCETGDITKEFLIKKIMRKGITLKGELHRKASVVVYRWEEGLDD
ncbi:hypothetical protein EVJ20_08100 [Exiguobacterium sp. SH0S1]|uniref:hypothetical protein n=1 Tax=Exiguobacterium sp. SH0S1 TaxID=2510949 RepID=UPI001039678A|nr:hypothetical protein [Exiguobacterium sp. SH0S1]TCI77910.1 hypothetical protein EVJ20_08100 [Exiguobacterium sp. SH0S1]